MSRWESPRPNLASEGDTNIATATIAVGISKNLIAWRNNEFDGSKAPQAPKYLMLFSCLRDEGYLHKNASMHGSRCMEGWKHMYRSTCIEAFFTLLFTWVSTECGYVSTSANRKSECSRSRVKSQEDTKKRDKTGTGDQAIAVGFLETRKSIRLN
ncbi:hypothetical protein SS1G_01306 [Sclerotinia sclerotiorum 1980 UF-70]|uniref:Uncharacterized protein n=1 Tax=Sclerotinia sclerotiorum (strain ATCC 18683 / 1980 / Ss-1) TaxID=665079 RepID=A7E7M8_SCLS1|nr:hypothetical protein SS1G_01306 [Sclerotinia sclerotiorum 1980 UF-70]EDN96380.1 hypothetical protein SS1G_01306 [Sclerotinia sclerotiorum 1980 UF-70]